MEEVDIIRSLKKLYMKANNIILCKKNMMQKLVFNIKHNNYTESMHYFKTNEKQLILMM